MNEIWSLQRSTRDRKVAGVAGALAARYGVDPLLVRICVVLLALSAGIGACLYLAAWLLLPTDADSTAPLERAFPGTARVSRGTLTTAVCVVTGAVAVTLGEGVHVGLVPVLAVGALLWFGSGRRSGARSGASRVVAGSEQMFLLAADDWRRRVDTQVGVGTVDWRSPHVTVERVAVPPAQVVGTRTAAPAPVWDGRVAGPTLPAGPAATMASTTHVPPTPAAYQPTYAPSQSVTGRVGIGPTFGSAAAAGRMPFQKGKDKPTWEPAPWMTEGSGSPAASPVARDRSRMRRRVGLATVGVALASVVILALAGVTQPTLFVAVPLLVVGLGLVVGFATGRPRGLLAVAVALMALTVIVSAPCRGDLTLQPSTSADLPRVVNTGVDDVVIDLSSMQVVESRTVKVHIGTGNLRIIAPEGVNLAVVAHIGIGTLVTPTGSQDGPGLFTYVQEPAEGGPMLTLDVDAGVGDVSVVAP